MYKSKRFERWFAQHSGTTRERVSDMWNGETYRDYRYYVEIAWAAWIAALNVTDE
jgi:hypothetical protein